MTLCTAIPITFSRCNGRKVHADFSGAEITSHAGVLLMREADHRNNATNDV